MDFFDNAVSMAKEALDVACKKTNEAVTVGKQKFDIAALEGKRAKDFEKLGALYFATVKKDKIKDSAIAELVAAIEEKNAKIEKLRKDVNEAKNKRICPNCNASIEKESVFCNACGQKLSIDSED